jgi:putative transposase
LVDASSLGEYSGCVKPYQQNFMLPLPEYKTHNHVKFLLNYHFVFIPKRRKKVLIGDVAIRTREIFLALSIEKGWDILA